MLGDRKLTPSSHSSGAKDLVAAILALAEAASHRQLVFSDIINLHTGETVGTQERMVDLVNSALAAARAEEREACAKIAHNHLATCDVAAEIEFKIRARG